MTAEASGDADTSAFHPLETRGWDCGIQLLKSRVTSECQPRDRSHLRWDRFPRGIQVGREASRGVSYAGIHTHMG